MVIETGNCGRNYIIDNVAFISIGVVKEVHQLSGVFVVFLGFLL